jgi:hypothetical protein
MPEYLNRFFRILPVGNQRKGVIPVKVEREDRIDRFGIDSFLGKLDMDIAEKLFGFGGKFRCRPEVEPIGRGHSECACAGFVKKSS